MWPCLNVRVGYIGDHVKMLAECDVKGLMVPWTVDADAHLVF